MSFAAELGEKSDEDRRRRTRRVPPSWELLGERYQRVVRLCSVAWIGDKWPPSKAVAESESETRHEVPQAGHAVCGWRGRCRGNAATGGEGKEERRKERAKKRGGHVRDRRDAKQRLTMRIASSGKAGAANDSINVTDG